MKFVVSTDCGHSRHYTNVLQAGIVWCPTCRAYVGVIAMEPPRPVREAVSPANGKDA